jgi:hypothetical protein
MRRRIEQLPVAAARRIASETPFQALLAAVVARHNADVAREEREARQHRKGKRR